MDLSTLPVFDFDTPWVAIIQLGLLFLSPQLVGHLTDKLTDPKVKVVLLGVFSLLGVILTRLLDYAVTDTWAQFDGQDLATIAINFVIAWFLSQAAFKVALKPSGASEVAQSSNVLQLFGPAKDTSNGDKLAA